jgi:hypothetical protein
MPPVSYHNIFQQKIFKIEHHQPKSQFQDF